MKTRQKFTAIFTAAFILSYGFPVFAEEPDQMPEETIIEQENTETDTEEIADDASLSETAAVPMEETEALMEDEMTDMTWQEAASVIEETPDETLPDGQVSQIAEETLLPETILEQENGDDFPVPEEAPAFHARIEHRMGYTVIGTFTDFTPDIVRIQTLYSLDGENWQAGAVCWNLFHLDTDDEDELYGLQNQTCLYDTYEPLKNYIAGEIDRFYLKLCITRKNGLSYETQSAVIERNGLQTIPEGTECRAWFSSAIAVREPDPAAPYRYRKYGRYQLTVSEDSTAEDVSALLPDTLPVEIQLHREPDFIATGIVDCPVTWKPLSLPQLSAGKSITISDAAEEIQVPSGTRISTPLGVFQLDEPLSLDTPPSTSEVELILNVSPEDKNPTGVLRAGKNGLETAFHHKPTGAVSIQAYVLTEGESKWTELSGLLLEDFNPSSTANSGYALVLRNDQEPYRSYLEAADTGEIPTPFFICLKIEGGIYDGGHLILAWPDIYEQLPDLPEVGGAGGNEGNAGADNKDDSTENGQRPNLPQIPDDNQKEQLPDPSPDDNPKEQQPPPASDPDGNREEQQLSLAQDNSHGEQLSPPAQDNSHGEQLSPPAQESNNSGNQRQTASAHTPEAPSAIPESQSALSTDKSVSDYQPERQSNQFIPNLPQTTIDTADTSAVTQKDSPEPASLAVLAAADLKEEESIPALPDARTAIEHTMANNSRTPLLLMTAAIAACCCIGAIICKAAGYSPFHRFAVKIRNIPHK